MKTQLYLKWCSVLSKTTSCMERRWSLVKIRAPATHPLKLSMRSTSVTKWATWAIAGRCSIVMQQATKLKVRISQQSTTTGRARSMLIIPTDIQSNIVMSGQITQTLWKRTQSRSLKIHMYQHFSQTILSRANTLTGSNQLSTKSNVCNSRSSGKKLRLWW